MEPGDPTDFRCYPTATHHQRVPLGATDWPIEILAVGVHGQSFLEWLPGYTDTHGYWRTTADVDRSWKAVGWREAGGPKLWQTVDGADPVNWPKHPPDVLLESTATGHAVYRSQP